MAFHIFAHQMGQTDNAGRYDTKAQAVAAVHRMKSECNDWSNEPLPRFEISTDPPYRPTYQFPDMSNHG